MSTKATITYGDDFHLYAECFENDHVWLQIEGESLQAKLHTYDGKPSVTVAIPVKVWRAIVAGWQEDPWFEDEDRDNRPIAFTTPEWLKQLRDNE